MSSSAKADDAVNLGLATRHNSSTRAPNEYWMPAFAGMTTGNRSRSDAGFTPRRNQKQKNDPGAKHRGQEPPNQRRLQTIEDLVGPEPLEPVQRLVERDEFVAIDAARLLHRAHVLLIERIDDVAHLAPLVGELDAHRAAVDARTLVVEVAHLDQLFEIVGNVGA